MKHEFVFGVYMKKLCSSTLLLLLLLLLLKRDRKKGKRSSEQPTERQLFINIQKRYNKAIGMLHDFSTNLLADGESLRSNAEVMSQSREKHFQFSFGEAKRSSIAGKARLQCSSPRARVSYFL